MHPSPDHNKSAKMGPRSWLSTQQISFRNPVPFVALPKKARNRLLFLLYFFHVFTIAKILQIAKKMEIEHSAFDGIIGGGLRGRNPQESCGKRLTFDDLNAIFHCQSGHKLNELLTELYEQTKKQRSRRSIWPVVNIALQRVGKGSDFYGTRSIHLWCEPV